jgi:hypothetical protein
MSNGFNKVKVNVNPDEVGKLLKHYKSIKRYMRSPLYQVKVMDGTETVVSKLVQEYEDNPLD